MKQNDPEFQFHNGSIKRETGIDWTLWTAMFQFHNGSIKSTQEPQARQCDHLVSIPQWFD